MLSLDGLELIFFTIESSALTACLFAAETLTLYAWEKLAFKF